MPAKSAFKRPAMSVQTAIDKGLEHRRFQKPLLSRERQTSTVWVDIVIRSKPCILDVLRNTYCDRRKAMTVRWVGVVISTMLSEHQRCQEPIMLRVPNGDGLLRRCASIGVRA